MSVSSRLCPHTVWRHVQTTKMLIKYCHDASDSAHSYRLSPRPVLAPPFRAPASCTQSQPFTDDLLRGLRELLGGVEEKGGWSKYGSNSLPFRDLFPLLAEKEKKKEGARSEYMKHDWRELIMEFGFDGVCLSLCMYF